MDGWMNEKKIIVNGKHQARLEAELKEAQGRASTRTLSGEQIEGILDNATCRIGIPNKHLKGCRLRYTGAEYVAKAYKYTPQSTHFDAEHNGRFWCITKIYRDACPRRVSNAEIWLTDEAKEAVLRSFALTEL